MAIMDNNPIARGLPRFDLIAKDAVIMRDSLRPAIAVIEH